MLISRLNERYGLDGNVLKWITSYLSGRNHTIKIGNHMSDTVLDQYGVPQGSVIGPILFTLYTAPIHDIISSYNLCSMFYADDTQIYTSCTPSDRDTALSNITNCLTDIFKWAAGNKMKVNPAKTEVLHFTSKFAPQPSPPITMTVGDVQVSPSLEARNLGAIMDHHSSLRPHVNNTCRSATAAIHKIGQIRNCLDENSTLTLVHSFVTSRLDFNNGLLGNIANKDIAQLQRVQNIAARITTKARRRENISPVLKSLHWLTIDKRIQFKILLLTFKALNGSAPHYISELLHNYTPARALRSQSQLLLQVPRFNTQFYGKRAFSITAPTLWNSLPLHIRSITSLASFQTAVKTHLFNN